VLMDGPDPDRHVAVLSKLKPKAVQPHALLGFKYFDDRAAVKRGLLELSVETPAGELTFFVVHLKSRYTDRGDDPMSELLRADEAEAVRNFVLRRFPDPSAARFLILGDCNDLPGSKPLRLLTRRGDTVITRMLPAVDARGETWTHFYHKDQTYSRIDYLLASPGLRPLVRDGAVRVYDGPGVHEASDHRPVVAILDVDRK